jgi:hypothetical protein
MLTYLIVLSTAPVLAQTKHSVSDQLLLELYKKDIYGKKANPDIKKFTRQPEIPQVVPIIPDRPINMGPDIFGPGTSSDQYRKPSFGQHKRDDQP